MLADVVFLGAGWVFLGLRKIGLMFGGERKLGFGGLGKRGVGRGDGFWIGWRELKFKFGL